MENGYLGGGIMAASLLLTAVAYWQFRRPGMYRFLDNELAATVAGFLLTAAIAFGVTVFAGNVYLTDTFSTIVSSGVVLAAFLILVLTIARTRTTPAAVTSLEPNSPAPITPETTTAHSVKTASGIGRLRRKAA